LIFKLDFSKINRNLNLSFPRSSLFFVMPIRIKQRLEKKIHEVVNQRNVVLMISKKLFKSLLSNFFSKLNLNPFFLSKKVKKSSNASSGPTPQICEHCGQVLVKNHQCQEKDASITCSICQKQMSTKSYRAHLQYHRHGIYIRTARI
jgi:hypothetical protein